MELQLEKTGKIGTNLDGTEHKSSVAKALY